MKIVNFFKKSRIKLLGIVSCLIFAMGVGTLGYSLVGDDKSSNIEFSVSESNFSIPEGTGSESMPSASTQANDGTVIIGGIYAKEMLQTFLSGDSNSTYLTTAMVDAIKLDSYGSKYRLDWPKTYLATATVAWLDTDITDFSWGDTHGTSVTMSSSKTLQGNGHSIALSPNNASSTWGNVTSKLVKFSEIKNSAGTALANTFGNGEGVYYTTMSSNFVAENDGTIKDVNFTLTDSFQYVLNNSQHGYATVSMSSFGIISGYNKGNINNCSLTIPSGVFAAYHKEATGADVRWTTRIVNFGGFAGLNAGTVSDCALNMNGLFNINSKGYQASGNYRGSIACVGGMVGVTYGGSLTNLRATGSGSFNVSNSQSNNSYEMEQVGKYQGLILGANTYRESSWNNLSYQDITPYNNAVGLATIDGIYLENCDFSFTRASRQGTTSWTDRGNIVGYGPASTVSNVYYAGNVSDNALKVVYENTSSSSVSTTQVPISTDDYTIEANFYNEASKRDAGSTIAAETGRLYLKSSMATDKMLWNVNINTISTSLNQSLLTYEDINVNGTGNAPYTGCVKVVDATRSMYKMTFPKSGLITSTGKRIVTFEVGTYVRDFDFGTTLTKEYDGTSSAPEGVSYNGSSVSTPGTTNGKNFSITVSGVEAEKTASDVGVYTYTLEKVDENLDYICIDDTNKLYYVYTAKSAVVTIEPKVLTVAFSDTADLIYNSLERDITATLGGIVGDEDVSAIISYAGDNLGIYTNPRNAGEYTATVSSLSGANAANYELAQTYTVTFSIAQREMTVTYSGLDNVVYDGNTHLATAIIDSGKEVISGDDAILSINYEKNGASLGGYSGPRNAGTYSVAAQLTGSDAGNYNITSIERTKTVSVRDLTITMTTPVSYVYDMLPHNPAYNVTGYAVGDEGLFIVTSKTLDATDNEVTDAINAGIYKLRVFFAWTSGEADYNMANVNTNYRLIGQDQSFTITKRRVYVFAEDINAVYSDEGLAEEVTYVLYDDAERTQLFSANAEGIVFTDSIKYYKENGDELTSAPVNVGTYYAIITVSEAGATVDNLEETNNARVEIIINKKLVNIDNVSMSNVNETYNGSEFTTSAVVEGTLAQGITFDGYTGGETSLNGRTNQGTSTIVATYSVDDNHIFAENQTTATKTATITIAKAVLDIADYATIEGKTEDYTGLEKTITYTEVLSLPSAITFNGYTGGETSLNGRTNAGTSIIVATFSIIDDNYTFMDGEDQVGSVTIFANLVINTIGLTFNWDYIEAFEYNRSTKTVLVESVVGEVNGETVAISYTDNSTTEAGTYIAAASISDTNYHIASGATLAWEITTRGVDLAWDVENGYIFTSDGSTKTVSATATTGVIGGDTVNVSTYTDNTSTNLGKHTAIATALDNDNYHIASGSTIDWYIKAASTIDTTAMQTEYNYDAGKDLTNLLTGATTNSDATIEYSILGEVEFRGCGDYTAQVAVAETDSYFASTTTQAVSIIGTTPVLQINLGKVYIGETIDQIKANAQLRAVYNEDIIPGVFTLSWADGTQPVATGEVVINIHFEPTALSYEVAETTRTVNVEFISVKITYNYTEISNTTETLEYGDLITEPTAMVVDGHTYEWRKSGSSVAYDFATPVTEDMEIVANWTIGEVNLSVTGNTTAIYNPDAPAITLTANVGGYYTTCDYTYKWYKEGDVNTTLSSSSTLTLSTVASSGKYYVQVSAVSNKTTSTPIKSETVSRTVTITPKEVDLTAITFDGVTADYDREEHAIQYTGTLPAEIIFKGYTGGETSLNGRTNAGTSTIVATFEIEDGNYTFANNQNQATLSADIVINTIGVDLTWDYTTPYTYETGVSRTVSVTDIEGVLTGDVVEVATYSNNSQEDAGEYTATVTLNNANYHIANGGSLAWVINKAVVDLTGITVNNYVTWQDGTQKTIVYNGTLPAMIGFKNYTGGENGTNGRTNSGKSTIVATFEIIDDNYTFMNGVTEVAEASISADIVILALQITANATTKTYEEGPITLTASATAGSEDLSTYSWIAYELQWYKSQNLEVTNLLKVYNSKTNAVEGNRTLSLSNVVDSKDYYLKGIVSGDGIINGTGIYPTKTISQTITINPAEMIATYTGVASYDYNEQTLSTYLADKFTVKSEFNNILTGVAQAYRYYATTDGTTKGAEILVDPSDVGKYIVEVSFSKENYTNLTKSVAVEIKAKEVVIEFTEGEEGEETVVGNGETIAVIPYGEAIPDFANEFKTEYTTGVVSEEDIVVEYYKHKTEKGIKPAAASVDLTEWDRVADISGAGKYMVVVYVDNANYTAPTNTYFVYITKEEVAINDSEFTKTYDGEAYVPNVVTGIEGVELTASYTIYRYREGISSGIVTEIKNAGTYRVDVTYAEDDTYFGATASYFVTINAKVVEVIWENLDEPVQGDVFAVKAYYLDVNNEKVYLPIIGIDIEDIRSGDYELNVTIADPNYVVSGNTNMAEITVPSDMLWWTFAIYGIALILIIINTVEALGIYGRKKTKKVVSEKDIAKEKERLEKLEKKETERRYKEYQREYQRNKKLEAKIKKNPEKYKALQDKNIQKANAEQDKRLAKQVDREYAINKKRAKLERSIYLMILKNPKKYQAIEKARIEKEEKRRIEAENKKLREECKRVMKENKRKKAQAELEAKKAKELEERQKIEAERKAKREAELEAERKIQEKRAQERAIIEEKRAEKNRLIEERRNEEKKLMEAKKAEEKKALAEQKLALNKLAEEKKAKELAEKQAKEAILAELKVKELAKKEAEKKAILDKKQAENLKKQEAKRRIEERKAIERAKKEELERRKEERRLADIKEKQRIQKALEEERIRKAQIEADKKAEQLKIAEAKKNAAGTKQAEANAKKEMERKLVEAKKRAKIENKEKEMKAIMVAKLNQLLAEQKSSKAQLQKRMEALNKEEKDCEIVLLNALNDLVQSGAANTPEGKRKADELLRRQQEQKKKATIAREKLEKEVKENDAVMLKKIDNVLGGKSIEDFLKD